MSKSQQTVKAAPILWSLKLSAGFIFLFLNIYLTTHEVSISNSISLSIVLGIQAIGGAITWILISNKSEYESIELIGLGIGIGTVLSTIFAQIFRATLLHEISWAIPTVVVSALLIKNSSLRPSRLVIKPVEPLNIYLICAFSLVVLSSFFFDLWPAFLVMIIGFFVFRGSINNQRSIFVRPGYLFFSTIFFVIIALITSSFFETKWFGDRTITDYILGGDGTYFEAAMRSLSTYGPLDSVFQSHIKFNYYFFSSAWAGTTSDAAFASPWVVTTQFALISTALGSLCLAFTISKRITPTSKVQHYIVLALMSASAQVGQPNFIFDIGSFSAFITILWFLSILVVINFFLEFPSNKTAALITVLMIVLFISKSQISVAVYLAFGSFSIFYQFTNETIKTKKLLLLTTVCSGIGIYFAHIVFIKPQAGTIVNYFNYKFALNGSLFGMLSNRFNLTVVFLFLIFKIYGFWWGFRSEKTPTRYFLFFLLSLVLAGTGASVLFIYAGGAANQYFFSVASVSAVFLVSKGIYLRSNLRPPNIWHVMFMILLGFITGFWSARKIYLRLFNFDADFYSVRGAIFRPLITMFLVSIAFFVILKVSSRTKLAGGSFALLLAAFFISFTPGVFVMSSIRQPLQESISRGFDPYFTRSHSLNIEISQISRAMNFLSKKAIDKDVIASNRKKPDALLPALTKLRSYADSYTKGHSSATTARYLLMDEFVKSPSDRSYRTLRGGCVTWFYVDKTEPEMYQRIWEPYAKIHYEDEFGAVLKMSNLVKLPSKC